MLRRLIAGFMTLAAAAVAVAGPQTYASRVQPIRAGVVVLNSSHSAANSYGTSSAPFAFYNLSVNSDIKPVGWNVYNPHAPSRVTPEINTRYVTLGKGSPPLGTEITKRDAPYWEVFLDNASSSDLADYDILLVSPMNRALLTPTEREKLRAFVDHGGILWIDPSALPYNRNGVDPANNFPVSFVTRNVGAGVDLSDYAHPLLGRPFPLSAREINILNNGLPNAPLYGSIDYLHSGTDFPAQFSSLFEPDVASFSSIRPVILTVVGNVKNETMGVAQIGDGFVVITARGAALKLNRVSSNGFRYDTNRGYTATLPPVLEPDGQAAAKLVVNMVSMLSEFRQQAGGTHKASGSQISLGAPLLGRGHDTSVTFDVTPGNTYGSVVYKGMVIASVRDGSGSRLVAYDPNPGRDLDKDGNADDGLPDPNPGSGADIIWESDNFTDAISMPVVAEVPDSLLPSGDAATDQVLIVEANGTLHAYNPVARLANSQSFSGQTRQDLYPAVSPPLPARDTSAGTPPPPTVHEGIAYIADTISKPGFGQAGRIWAVNLRNGKRMRTDQDWFLGGNTSPFQAQGFTFSPTIGYIPILDNSGGSDKVMYVPMKKDSNSPAGVVSVWLGARGEKPGSPPTIVGNDLQIETRASQQGGLPIYVRHGADSVPAFNPRLTVMDSTGVPWTANQMVSYFNGSVTDSGGVLAFRLRPGVTALPTDTQFRVDYTIDLGDNTFQGVAESAKRGSLQLPDVSGDPRRDITGPVALTAKGSIFVTASGNGRAGLYGFREEGRGNFRCTMRYELYPQYKFNGQGRAQDTFAPVVEDNDPVINFQAAMLKSPFSNFTIVGGPAVRNDQVFITVAAGKASGVPTMLLMALASEPDTARFRIDSVPDGSVLVQPDLARSSFGVPGVADVPTVIPSSSYQWDPDTHILRIENLMNIPKGQIQQCVSLSQPIYLRTPGGSDVPLIPDNIGGATWSPMLWYSVINGYQPQTGPLVTGDTMFVGGKSWLPNILLNGTLGIPKGLLYATSASISPSDDFLKITPGRPWLKQLWTLNDEAGLATNPDVLWPQMMGIDSLSDYIVRLNQTVLANSGDVLGIAGGDGTFVALGSGGIYTFNRADVVIADQGRIAIVDGAGNPVWSTNSTSDAGTNGAAGNVHPIVRPTRAYRINETDLLVADAGANRVFRMNLSGIETRSISEIHLDPNFRPTGFAANGPLTLNDPRDVTTYSNVVYFPQSGGVTLGDNESATGFEYWDHYLIADSGNHRLVEVIDRYAFDIASQRILDPIKVGGVPQIGVLFWHSPAMVSGKAFNYNSINRIGLPSGQFVYVAGLGSVLPTAADTGAETPGIASVREAATGNGGVVIFDPLLPNQPVVANSVAIPAIGADRFWNNVAGAFSSPATSAYVKYFSNVSSVSSSFSRSGGNYVIRIMVADSTGVYEANYVPGVGISGATLSLNWMLPNSVYRTMRFAGAAPDPTNPADLRAVYAHRVDDDNVLIVNGYYGKYRQAPGSFQGEILQVDGRTPDYTKVNFGFNSGSITLRLSSVAGTRGLVLPAFADRG